MKKTIVLDPMPEDFWDKVIFQKWDRYIFPSHKISNEDVKIAVIRTKTLFTKTLMDSFPQLTLIIRAGSGYDNIDLLAAQKRNIRVCTTPRANTRAAYEHTVSLILALLKRHQSGKSSIIERGWKSNVPLNWELSDLKALIVGYGRIGSLVTDFLRQSDSQVKIVDPYLTGSETALKGIELIDHNNGLKWCNLISYHCPLSWETRDYFCEESFELINEPIWLVNAARGSIVNEKALLKGLQNGLISGAALDVFEHEPWYNEKLVGINNVYLTPHTGSFTERSKDRLISEVLKTWSEYCFNDHLPDEVDYRFFNNDPNF